MLPAPIQTKIDQLRLEDGLREYFRMVAEALALVRQEALHGDRTHYTSVGYTPAREWHR